MKIKKIRSPHAIADIENDNIDVFVEVDDGHLYTFTVFTPKNYYWYMDNEGLDYVPASPPDIIVRSLTEENIRNAVETYLDDDGYWLKLYYLAGEREGAFDISAMDKLIMIKDNKVPGMKIKEISYPVALTQIEDIENDNIDVFVEADDGHTYTLTVSTPNNYYWYMDKEGLDYMPAAPPDIIVRSLTEENIRNAIENYMENDGYWLKLYYLAGKREGVFDIKAMDKMMDKIKKEREEIFGDEV